MDVVVERKWWLAAIMARVLCMVRVEVGHVVEGERSEGRPGSLEEGLPSRVLKASCQPTPTVTLRHRFVTSPSAEDGLTRSRPSHYRDKPITRRFRRSVSIQSAHTSTGTTKEIKSIFSQTEDNLTFPWAADISQRKNNNRRADLSRATSRRSGVQNCAVGFWVQSTGARWISRTPARLRDGEHEA
jgi:hypothetical protein